jgi:nucleoside 2-deoxyribosyltransferase
MSKVIGANKNRESKPVIYLAGLLDSNWQDKVINSNSSFDYFDPRKAESTDADVFTWYDLNAIARSNGMVAYLGRDNPAGHNMAFECGFAACLRKPIFLIVDNPLFCDYIDMIKASARVCYCRFDLFLQDWGSVQPEMFV